MILTFEAKSLGMFKKDAGMWSHIAACLTADQCCICFFCFFRLLHIEQDTTPHQMTLPSIVPPKRLIGGDRHVIPWRDLESG